MQYLLIPKISNPFNFYIKSRCLKDFPDNPWGRALKHTENFLPVKLLSFGNEFKNIGILPVWIRKFIVQSENFYMIPITTPGRVVRGFIFQLVSVKKFRRLDDDKPLFYGFHRFDDFKYDDYIIVSEGVKDAEAVAKYYKYSLAVLGNHISTEQAEVLRRLTRNIIFIGDNDVWGHVNEKFNKRAGAVVSYPPVKDLGMIFEDESRRIVESYLLTLMSVYGLKRR